VLLDTHAWLWAAEGNARRLGRAARRLIERARTAGDLQISVVSIFEVAALHAAGRLDLVPSASGWIREAIDAGAFRVMDVTLPVALDAGGIPASALPDPADRLLVAAAIDAGVPLLTRDTRILSYARGSRRLRAVDARL
jgi:PIN domain nuclease of toxin-antitoxin system